MLEYFSIIAFDNAILLASFNSGKIILLLIAVQDAVNVSAACLSYCLSYCSLDNLLPELLTSEATGAGAGTGAGGAPILSPRPEIGGWILLSAEAAVVVVIGTAILLSVLTLIDDNQVFVISIKNSESIPYTLSKFNNSALFLNCLLSNIFINLSLTIYSDSWPSLFGWMPVINSLKYVRP